MSKDICAECGLIPVIREEGLCQECLDDLNHTLHKLDIYILDNWTD